MKNIILLSAIAALILLLGISGREQASASAGGDAKVASALGVARVGGEDVLVEVFVAVAPGASARDVAEHALDEQGARPLEQGDLESAAYTTTGLVWDQFSDAVAGNDFVVQNYNPSKDPTGGAALAALQNTHATWTNVPSSSFTFSYGGTTSRCPSLVRECPGPQFYDGRNDVGWLRISGCCTLGVTWYSTTRDEADKALNTSFKWSTSLPTPSGRFDVETVFLHENGHVAGLGHSADPSAVMYASYNGVKRTLGADDVAGISALYP
ncbi:MAG: matrixin family metalloprotease [Dehalococcoidia bacterium]|nr:matrixin family metalloprotease [Dehalococcoidia bacterium]